MSTSKNHSAYYKQVYETHDPAPEGAHGWIQWKGTEVCIDLRCPCGARLHFDGAFFYTFQCGSCNQVYAVGQHVKLIPLTDELRVLGGIEGVPVVKPWNELEPNDE